MRRTVFCTLAVQVAAGAPALAQEPTCSEPRLDATWPDHVWAEWVTEADGAPTVAIRAPEDEAVTVTVETRARFGTLEHAWSAAIVDLVPGEQRRVELAVPPEAHLHELADTYVTRLYVRVESVDAEANMLQEVALDPRFLAWPEGEARVWSKDELAVDLPNGILDAQLATEVAQRWAPDEIVPPPWDLAPDGGAIVEDPGDEPDTRPADDNTDEEA